MPIDTLLVYCGAYGEVADAVTDYDLVKDPPRQGRSHRRIRRAIIQRNDKGQGECRQEAPDAGHTVAGMRRGDLKILGALEAEAVEAQKA